MESTNPKHIGRYQIVSQLAEGNRTRVFLAIHRSGTGVCKPAVLKQIQHDPAWTPEIVARFLDDARLTARFNHATIAKTFQVFTEGNASHLVMEHLEGQPLSEILRQLPLKNLPLEEHLWILAQVLSGLHYVHVFANYDGTPLGIVHGEVSPMNVFVTYQGEVKLLGFGMAKLGPDFQSDRVEASNATFSYRAPQRLTGGAPDVHGDVYSVGAMLREALLRIPQTVNPMVTNHANQKPPGTYEPLHVARPDLPEDLTQICDRAMAPNATDCYATAAEFQQALRRYLVQLPETVEPASLATRLQTHFADDRQAVSKLIFEQMAIPQEVNGGSKSGSGSHSDQVTTKEVPIILDPPNQPRKISAKLLSPSPKHYYGLAFIGLTLAIVAVIRWNPRESSTQVTVPSQVAPSTVPHAVPPRPQPAISTIPQPSAPQETIQVTIDVLPKSAKLRLDGHAVVGNPFQATVMKDHTVHTISATAPGFIPFKQSTPFSTDLHLTVTLQPHHTRIPHASKPHLVKEPPTLRAPPPTLRAPPTPAMEPGMHLTRSPSRRSLRQLDEKDPYLP